MSLFESNTPDFQSGPADAVADAPATTERPWFSARTLANIAFFTTLALLILGIVAFFSARYYLRDAARKSLPQLDGTLALPGLSAPVTVQRDAHGVPHIHAAGMDDLVEAQAFIVTSDRLFQMDILRRHAAGELAEVFGLSLLNHDRLQRTLQIRAAADRAIAVLPPDQLHLLQVYARGVNASIAAQRAHLPLEFRILRYTPAPWIPRDSILVSLAMFQDLTDTFPTELARESLASRLPPAERAELLADLYPVGSWRDHPPAAPIPDLTIEGPPIEQIPLDESQSHLAPPFTLPQPKPHLFVIPEGNLLLSSSRLPGAPGSIVPSSTLGLLPPGHHPTHAPLFVIPEGNLLLPLSSLHLSDFTPGSNNWVVSGAHTATGKPLLSDDMHLAHSVPGIWYETDLEAPTPTGEPFHAAGVTIPGLPLIVVGHNDHIAWGFTNFGADVQDVYIESTRGTGPTAQFRAADLSWQPVLHLPEVIRIHGLPAQTFDVAATRHGDAITPILDPALTPAAVRGRILSLRWTMYDPPVLQIPFFAVNSAHDWPSFLAAFSNFGGPTQNVVYADDAGHIGYHAVGRVPLRGPASIPFATPANLPPDLASPVIPRSPTQSPTIAANPSPLTQTDIAAPAAPLAPQFSGPISPVPQLPNAAREWDGYIPFDQLPQIFDPPGGVIATANARTAPDDYRYPITLNWAAPYRNERIWKSLGHRTGLTPADMLNLQSDIYSDFDHVLAQRLAYAIDNALLKPARPLPAPQIKTLRQAADLLRTFNGRMSTDSPAPAIVAAAHAVLWPMLLAPKLHPQRNEDLNSLYVWGEKDYALEQVLAHTPPRWLPPDYATWNDFLAAAVLRGLAEAKAPADLARWRYGAVHILDIENPVFAQSPLLTRIFGLPTGPGPQPQSGDGTTVKQVGRTFGPSERFTADLADLNRSTLNIVLGESGNPLSPYFLDQFPAWQRGTTYPESAPPTHTLTLIPN